MSEILPPAVQRMIVDASEAVAGLDTEIAAAERLAAAMGRVTESARLMEEATAAASTGAAAGLDAGALEASAAAAADAATADEALAGVEKAVAEASQQAAAAQTQLAEAEKAATTTSGLYRDAQGRLRNAQGQFAAETKAATTAAEENAAANSKAGEASAAFGKKAKMAMLGFGAATLVSIDKAMKFNTEVTRLYTAAGLTVPPTLDNVRKKLLALGDAYGYTGTQMAQAMYHGISAGLKFNQALAVTAQAANLANIHGADLEATTYALSSVMKSYDLQTKDTVSASALLNAIVGQGDMRFQDFNQSIKNWTPTAAAMGISIQSMGAALAYLTDRGNSAEVASYRLTTGLAMMTSGSKQANTMLNSLGLTADTVTMKNRSLASIMEDAGLTTNKLALDLRKPDGIYEALKDLQDAFHKAGASSEEAEQVMGKIFGGGRSDKAILSLMHNLDGLKTKYKDIGEAVHKYGKISEQANKTPEQQWKDLKASVANLALAFGTILLPAAVGVMHALSTALDPIVKFATDHPDIIKFIGAIVIGMMAVVAWVKVWTIAQAALDAVLDANPISLIVMAIAALVIGVIYAYKHVKWFHDAVDATFHAIGAVVGWLVDFVKQHWQLLTMIILGPLGVWIVLIIKYWKQISNAVSTAVMWIIDFVKNHWRLLLIIVGGPLGLLVVLIIKYWKQIGEGLSLLWNDIIEPVFNLIVAIVRLCAAIMWWWWSNVTMPVFHLVGALAMWLWNNAISPTFSMIGTIFRLIGGAGMWLWNNALGPAFRGIGAVAVWLWNNALGPAFHAIGSVISAVWNNVIYPVYKAIVDATKWVGDHVAKIFGWIGHQINTVTGGLNNISKALGFHGFAEGGPVPGAPGQPMLAVVHGGEYVLSREMIANITGGGGGTTNPLDALSSTQIQAANPASGGGGTTVYYVTNVNVAGSIMSEKQLFATMQQQTLRHNRRNPNNGLALTTGGP